MRNSHTTSWSFMPTFSYCACVKSVCFLFHLCSKLSLSYSSDLPQLRLRVSLDHRCGCVDSIDRRSSCPPLVAPIVGQECRPHLLVRPSGRLWSVRPFVRCRPSPSALPPPPQLFFFDFVPVLSMVFGRRPPNRRPTLVNRISLVPYFWSWHVNFLTSTAP